MDRQEAIQTLSKVGKISVSYAEDLYDSFFPKPIVPQCVADWYEEHKDNLNSEIYYLIRHWEAKERTSDFYKWFDNPKNEAIKILVNMHQFGYEVKKEPRYLVKIKATGQCLSSDNNWPHFNLNFKTAFTKSKLERLGFGWVFSCEGVEVKEVE